MSTSVHVALCAQSGSQSRCEQAFKDSPESRWNFELSSLSKALQQLATLMNPTDLNLQVLHDPSRTIELPVEHFGMNAYSFFSFCY